MLVKCSSKLVFLTSLFNSYSGTSVKNIKPALSICSGGVSVRFAGHSKWQNIKHTKAAKDKLKGQTFGYHVMEITYACAKASTDPKCNSNLARAIEAARAANVAMTTIKRALDRIEARQKNPVITKLNYKGQKGLLLLVTCITDNPSRTRGDLNRILKKYKFVKGSKENEHLSVFYGRGFIKAKPPKNVENISDKSIEDAIEVGAEEVYPDEDKPEILNFITDLQQFPKVRSKLEGKNYEIVFAEEQFLPRSPVPVDEEEYQTLQNLIEEIEEMSDVEKAYLNIE